MQRVGGKGVQKSEMLGSVFIFTIGGGGGGGGGGGAPLFLSLAKTLEAKSQAIGL